MPDASVYRRVPSFRWDKRNNRPQAAAFHTREGEPGLSVFDTRLQTPRGVLQNALDNAKAQLASPDAEIREKGRKFLEKQGDTVEALVANGWYVVRLPVSAFTDLGFTLDEAEPDGHRNVIGSREDFETHSLSWVDAEVMTEKEAIQEVAR